MSLNGASAIQVIIVPPYDSNFLYIDKLLW